MFDLIIKPSGWEVTDDQRHVCPHTFPYCAIILDETERGSRGLQVESKVRSRERPTKAQQIEQNILQKKAKMNKKIEKSKANKANRVKKSSSLK